MKASGLRHSDLHMAEHDYGVPLPAVFGHELAGIVKEIAPDVRAFSIGDHVVGSLIQCCGHCSSCLEGRTYQCEHPEETVRGAEDGQRLTRNGQPVTPMFGTAAFAEFALMHEKQLARVPKELPFSFGSEQLQRVLDDKETLSMICLLAAPAIEASIARHFLSCNPERRIAVRL